MSGEGVLPSSPKRGVRFEAGREAERADLLAYLKRRRANAATVQSIQPDWKEYSADRRAQLEIMIQEIETGLHLGVAETEAALAASTKED